MGWIIALIVIYILYRFIKKAGKEESPPSPPINVTIEPARIFETHSYRSKEQSKNKSKGKWIRPGEEILINGISITKGLFYFGGVLEGQNYGGTECSLLDEQLKVKSTNYSYTDSSLGYWPSFQTLSPEGRGAYLNWLASNRDMPDTPIGYVFIYFYGLERRIVVDCKDRKISPQEVGLVCEEIIRLRSIFIENNSFNHYSSSLLEYIAINFPEVYTIPDNEIKNSIFSNVFKFRLSALVNADKPIPPELAYVWVAEHPDYNFRTPSRRCSDEFKALFISKYKNACQEGIKVKPNKTKLRLEYRPASNSLKYFQYGREELCDPTVLSAPVKKLAEMAFECSDALDSYSRYLGKQGTSKDDLGAIALLPDSLIEELKIPMLDKFKALATDVFSQRDGVVEFKELWSLTQLPLPNKATKKDLELICNLVEKSGFSFAPHPRFHSSVVNIDGQVVLYRINKLEPIKNNVIYDDVAVKLRLGSIIAHADLKIDDKEVSFLEETITRNDNLNQTEKISLHAYLRWLLISPSDINVLKSALGKLRDNDTTVIRKLLVNTALSDGRVDANEVKEIEKLYVKLGLDKTTVPADIHQFSSIRTTVSNSTIEKVDTKGVKLDDSLLKHLEHETKAAQNILNEIFKDGYDEEEANDGNVTSALENKALEIYRLISDKERLGKAEFEVICSKYGFFVDAAVDSINEWAFEMVAAPVIECTDEIIIDREIAEELNELEVLS